MTDVAPTFAVFDRAMLRTQSRGDFVFESLRDAIWDGRIGRGERVREEEIARNLGVSRTPVREALQRLQQRGLLVVGAGRGLVVNELRHDQVIELYAMRELLEGTAAGFAAQHASANDIAALRQLSRMFAASLGDSARLALINRELHSAIYVAAHNRYLQRTLQELHDALTLLPSTTFSVPGRSEEAIHEHEQVIDAIEHRDADAAIEAARAHIRGAQQTRLMLMFEFAGATNARRA
jgi:DNA-binding GntR family transcriptional regulator